MINKLKKIILNKKNKYKLNWWIEKDLDRDNWKILKNLKNFVNSGNVQIWINGQ